MKSFANYTAGRNLAEFIFDNELDVDNFCESVLNLYADTKDLNEQNLNEFIIQKLARGVSGLLGATGGLSKDAGGSLGSMAKTAGGALGSAAKAIGGAFSQAAQAVGGAAQSAGKYIGDKYEQGRRAEAVRQINDRIKGLENSLVSLGLEKSQVSDFLGKINAHLLGAVKSGKIGTVQKASDVRAQERQKQMAGGAEAWEGLGRQMAAQQRVREKYLQQRPQIVNK